ncbi:MAG: SMC-Scp complex subunit ScpB [Planctomycetes bacterium]|nr:SMC-Scp complex subunit ScpB [Planctomycetota bacterium]
MISDEATDPPALGRILEALLFATGEPLSLGRLAAVLKEFDAEAIRQALDVLRATCDREQRSYALEEVGGGYRLLTRSGYAEYVGRLERVASQERLSPAALETLAIIAFKQPVIKAEVDAIRGVKSDGTIQSLLRRRLVRVAGRAEVLGRPLLYGTTRQFLDQFGLKSLEDLPSLEEAILRIEAAEAEALGAERVEVTPVELDGGDLAAEDDLLTRELPEAAVFRRDPDAETAAPPEEVAPPELDPEGLLATHEPGPAGAEEPDGARSDAPPSPA